MVQFTADRHQYRFLSGSLAFVVGIMVLPLLGTDPTRGSDAAVASMVLLTGLVSLTLTALSAQVLLNRWFIHVRAVSAITQALKARPSSRIPKRRHGFHDPSNDRRRDLARVARLLRAAARRPTLGDGHPFGTLLLHSAKAIEDYLAEMASLRPELPERVASILRLNAVIIAGARDQATYLRLQTLVDAKKPTPGRSGGTLHRVASQVATALESGGAAAQWLYNVLRVFLAIVVLAVLAWLYFRGAIGMDALQVVL